MKKYEAMLIVNPDLSDEEKKNLFDQIGEAVTKNSGKVTAGSVWQERRKLFFPIKKRLEGVYYLLNFESDPKGISKITQAYSLNENILRAMITKLE